MRWKGRRQSDNVEDRRHDPIPGGALPVRPIQLLFKLAPWVLHRFGFRKGMLLLAIGGLILYFGSQYLDQTPVSSAPPSASEEETVAFVRTVLADTEETWQALMWKRGQPYEEPRVVLFRSRVSTGCGLADKAIGPFYCPVDRKIYLDLSFFDELAHRFGAPGDFAQAYVIAHEVGHHVQNLLGISGRVQAARRQMSEAAGNRLSVRLELQADCFAGLWAHHAERTRDLLDKGDIEEGLAAANAIGDDRLQKQATGHVEPDSFTHGTSEQRMRWFMRGYRKGTLDACDTFSVPTL